MFVKLLRICKTYGSCSKVCPKTNTLMFSSQKVRLGDCTTAAEASQTILEHFEEKICEN